MLTLTLAALLSSNAHAQIVNPGPGLAIQDAIPVWNGFNFFWDDMNHRLQRLGAFVDVGSCTSLGCTADYVHAGASGTGDDVGNMTGRFTKIRTSAAGFEDGTASFWVITTEGNTFSDTLTVEVPVPFNMRDKDKYVAVMNGFDLNMSDAVGEPIPDKLGELHIDLSAVTYNTGTDTATFTISVELLADCDSLECMEDLGWDNVVEYTLDIPWVLVAGNTGSFAYAVDAVNTDDAYAWDEYDSSLACSDLVPCPGNEIFIADHTFSNTIDGANNYQRGALAFRGIDVSLDSDEPDEGMYLWSLAMQTKDPTYTASTGTMTYDYTTFAKEWFAWDPWGAAFWSEGHAGDASLRAEVVLLQFASGTVTTASTSESWLQSSVTEVATDISF